MNLLLSLISILAFHAIVCHAEVEFGRDSYALEEDLNMEM
jgi:hypothetical protein